MNKHEGGLASPEHMAGWTPSLHLKAACELLEGFTLARELDAPVGQDPVVLQMAKIHTLIANAKMLGLVRRP
jgi:predicted amidohydrolase YtcJ